MKFLKCILCEGELDVLGEDGHRKITKCRECDHQPTKLRKKEPEVVIIRKGERK